MYFFCSVLFCFLLVEFDLNCLVQEIIPPSLDIKYHKHHCSRRKQKPTRYLFFLASLWKLCVRDFILSVGGLPGKGGGWR